MNTRSESEIYTTKVMAAPMVSDAYAKRDYPRLSEPEAVHARLWGDHQKHEYHLHYNGSDIIHLSIKADDPLRVRCYSDGNFQSTPFVQQFFVQALHGTKVSVRFTFPTEIFCMRPRRAKDGEAILSQVGHPLIYGVNGLYVPEWDMLLSWHGAPFSWNEASIRNENGVYTCSIETTAAMRPFMILLRPRYYSEHLGYKGFAPWKRRGNDKAVAGWCSWEAFHDDITQNDLARAAEKLTPLHKYGLEYMQLDDGFEHSLLPRERFGSVSDAWLETNDKFPDGHRGIISTITEKGFKPGIWVCPNITNMATAEDGGYCLKTKDGALYGDWIRGVIDCLPKTLEEQVLPCFQKLREAGYRYVKIDGMRHLTYDGFQEMVRRGYMTGDEAFKRVKQYIETARKGLGEDVYLLSCWGVLTPCMGVADGMRVSTDANPLWCAFSMQLYDTARWFFAQRILFTLDPDHVCVRSKYPWARMLLSLVSLTGGLYMISDPPEAYDDDRLELIQKTLPPTCARAAETGCVDLTIPTCVRTFPGYDDEKLAYDMTYIDAGEPSPFSSLWAHHYETAGRIWCVVQRAAVVPLPETDVPLEKLGLDPTHRYCVFDFWKQQALGFVTGSVPIPALSLGDTCVYSICDVTDGMLCLIGSDRHVSMDTASVTRVTRSADSFGMALRGWDGLVARYTLYNGGKALEIADCKNVSVSCENMGSFTRITARFAAEDAYLRVK